MCQRWYRELVESTDLALPRRDLQSVEQADIKPWNRTGPW